MLIDNPVVFRPSFFLNARNIFEALTQPFAGTRRMLVPGRAKNEAARHFRRETLLLLLHG
jgi:hypothetical protein